MNDYPDAIETFENAARKIAKKQTLTRPFLNREINKDQLYVSKGSEWIEIILELQQLANDQRNKLNDQRS